MESSLVTRCPHGRQLVRTKASRSMRYGKWGLEASPRFLRLSILCTLTGAVLKSIASTIAIRLFKTTSVRRLRFISKE